VRLSVQAELAAEWQAHAVMQARLEAGRVELLQIVK